MRPTSFLYQDKLYPRLVFSETWPTPFDCKGVIEECLRYAQPCDITRSQGNITLWPKKAWSDQRTKDWLSQNKNRMRSFNIKAEERY